MPTGSLDRMTRYHEARAVFQTARDYDVPVEWVEAAVAYERRWWRRLGRWCARVLRGEDG